MFRFKHFLTDQVMKEPLQVCGNREKIIVLPSYNMHGGTISSNILSKIFLRNIKIFLVREAAEKKGRVGNGKPPVADTNHRVDTKNKKLIEVQPSPSPEN